MLVTKIWISLARQILGDISADEGFDARYLSIDDVDDIF